MGNDSIDSHLNMFASILQGKSLLYIETMSLLSKIYNTNYIVPSIKELLRNPMQLQKKDIVNNRPWY